MKFDNGLAYCKDEYAVDLTILMARTSKNDHFRDATRPLVQIKNWGASGVSPGEVKSVFDKIDSFACLLPRGIEYATRLFFVGRDVFSQRSIRQYLNGKLRLFLSRIDDLKTLHAWAGEQRPPST